MLKIHFYFSIVVTQWVEFHLFACPFQLLLKCMLTAIFQASIFQNNCYFYFFLNISFAAWELQWFWCDRLNSLEL